VEDGAGGEDGGDRDAAAPLERSKFDDGGVGGQLFDQALEGEGFGNGEEAGDLFPEVGSGEVVAEGFEVNLGGLHSVSLEWKNHDLRYYTCDRGFWRGLF